MSYLGPDPADTCPDCHSVLVLDGCLCPQDPVPPPFYADLLRIHIRTQQDYEKLAGRHRRLTDSYARVTTLATQVRLERDALQTELTDQYRKLKEVQEELAHKTRECEALSALWVHDGDPIGVVRQGTGFVPHQPRGMALQQRIAFLAPSSGTAT